MTGVVWRTDINTELWCDVKWSNQPCQDPSFPVSWSWSWPWPCLVMSDLTFSSRPAHSHLHWAAPGSGTETQWEIITEIITTDNSLCLQFSSGRWYENIFIRRIDQIDKFQTKLWSVYEWLVGTYFLGFIFNFSMHRVLVLVASS